MISMRGAAEKPVWWQKACADAAATERGHKVQESIIKVNMVVPTILTDEAMANGIHSICVLLRDLI
jgi:hypothetical protein